MREIIPKPQITMKLLPDKEKKKKFMKNGLPVIFAVAWTPIIWMVLVSIAGPLMERMFHAWQPVVIIIAVATVLVMIALIRLFKMAGSRIFDNGQ
jgi:membrane protein YdbS with pleckstrin-like domain